MTDISIAENEKTLTTLYSNYLQENAETCIKMIFISRSPDKPDIMQMSWLKSARIPMKGFCWVHVMPWLQCFHSRTSRQTTLTSKAYTCLLHSVCPHKLLWLTEKHLCLCVLPWRQGHPNTRTKSAGVARGRLAKGSSDGVAMWEWLQKAWQSAHSLCPGFLSRKISQTVGGRGQPVHKQRQGGIYGSGCCMWPQA